jgi:hypothetical protein
VKAEFFLCLLLIGFEGEKVISGSIRVYQMPGAVLICFSQKNTFGIVAAIGKLPN